MKIIILKIWHVCAGDCHGLSKGKKKRNIYPNCGKETFLQSDPDGCRDVPIEQKLIRRDIREGV